MKPSFAVAVLAGIAAANFFSPTSPSITEEDLRHRVGILAADSMEGRQKGTRGQFLAAEYIAREFARLKLEPAGEGGTYFQEVPLTEILPDPGSWIAVGGERARPSDDYLIMHAPSLRMMPLQVVRSVVPLDSVAAIDGATVLFAGRIDDTAATASAEAMKGRIVLFDAARSKDGQRILLPADELILQPRFSGAAAVAIAHLDLLSPGGRETFRKPWQSPVRPSAGTGPAVLFVTPEFAEQLLGIPLAKARPGQLGERVSGVVRVVRRKTGYPTRNVIAVLPGRDRNLAASMVAVGGHSDGIGRASRSYAHDSLRMARWDAWRARLGADTVGLIEPVQAGSSGVDSTFNGANDNASAVAAMLEIAESMSASASRPRRSVLFFSSGAEEGGLNGAIWFLSHPTRPLDSITSYVNMEMVGRGARTLRGERTRVELSYSGVPPTVLVAHADSANRSLEAPTTLNVTDGGCGSDHAAFNARGLPAISFQARGDPDYHEITDEARYLNYGHLLAVTRLVYSTVERVANAQAPVPRPTRAPRADEGC